MRKFFKLLMPAFIAVALFASCEDQMDEIVVKDDASIENTDKGAVIPPKDRLVNPYKK